MQELGIYVHIPFCKRKCYYCDFVSFCDKDKKVIDEYVECIKKEIEYKYQELQKYENQNSKNYIINTIYIGGGTPSYIDGRYIYSIICTIKELFNVKNDCEITIEVNPDSVTEEQLDYYKKAGINRISIGLQTSNDNLLEKIGRVHNLQKFDDSYKILRYFSV